MEGWDDEDNYVSLCLHRYYRTKASAWWIRKAQTPWRRAMRSFNEQLSLRLEEYGDIGDYLPVRVGRSSYHSSSFKYLEEYTAEEEIP